MLNNSPIDAVTLRVTEALLQQGAGEADQLSFEQIRSEAADRSIDSICEELERSYRESPGEFGLDYASALVLPLVLPAVHAAVKRFVAKLLEGAAGEVGKLTVQSIRSAMTSNSETGELKPEVWAEIEQSFAARARDLKLPASSYAGLLEGVRRNPKLLL
jgi:hypothetical protein